MPIYDDSVLNGYHGAIQFVRPAGRRKIEVAIHDVDGTHSLIRTWPPVMSRLLHYAMTCGLADDFDRAGVAEQLSEVIAAEAPDGLLPVRVNQPMLEETDRFCTESAGLAALTQMEWAIRRAIELDCIPDRAELKLTESQRRVNSEIIRRIWAGQERFADLAEPADLLAFITERTPRLFKLYDQVLNRASRHRNLALARQNPAKWRIPGAMEFMEYLHGIKVRNFFVTGSVVSDGGMADDVAALDYPVGPGKLVEDLVGCPWDRKWPKNEVMADLCKRLNLNPATTLILGDGRSEIQAGVDMGAVTISRLDASAARLRQLHQQIGANLILADFTDPVLRQVLRAE